MKADEFGPPPQKICAPTRVFPSWDATGGPYGTTIDYSVMCAKALVSPMTADELMTKRSPF